MMDKKNTDNRPLSEVKEELKAIASKIYFDEPMSRHTTIRVGGAADALVYPQSVDEILSLCRWAQKKGIPYFVMGAGSNLLVRDHGIRGLVLQLGNALGEMRIESEEEEESVLHVDAGVGMPRLVDFCAENGLRGLEPISGIPGNIGGGLMMNAGTPEGEISEHLLDVTFIDMTRQGRNAEEKGKIVTWEKERVQFSYRTSHFPKGAVILSARFSLHKHSSEKIRGVIQKHRQYRLETQPLNVPNLGSVFRNPTDTKKKKKVSAGQLIEEVGLKGVRVGGARISEKHANWILNEGGAKAHDVIALIGLIKDKVKEKTGVVLETEVKIVGED